MKIFKKKYFYLYFIFLFFSKLILGMENDEPYDVEPMEIDDCNSILSFPDEILTHIISYLDSKSYKNLSQTCRYFYHLMPMPKLVMKYKKPVCLEKHFSTNEFTIHTRFVAVNHCISSKNNLILINKSAIDANPYTCEVISKKDFGVMEIYNLKTLDCEKCIKTIKLCPHLNLTKNENHFFSYYRYAPQQKIFKIWDIETGKCLKSFDLNYYDKNENYYHPEAIETFPDNTHLLVGYSDGKYRLWDWEQGKCLKTVTAYKYKKHDPGPRFSIGITAIAIADDGSFFATVSLSKSIKLWDSQTMECFRILKKDEDSDYIKKIYISPNNKFIIANSDTKILSWNLTNNDQNPQILNAKHQNHIPLITATAISPNKLVASGDSDCTINLWNIENGELLHSWNNPIKKKYFKVSCLKFSEDGKTIYGTFTPSFYKYKNLYVFKILLD